MSTADLAIYAVIVIIAIFEIYMIIYLIEHLVCINVLHQVPFVATGKHAKKLLVQEIKKHYPNTKNICEIGSGYGSLARFLGKKTGANVVALENMPFSAFISKTADLIQNKSKTIKCDAFDYLTKTKQKFDIGIAYLSPNDSFRLLKYKNKIKTLITLDFAISGVKPTRTIDVGHGYTFYNHKPYPHKIFIYEFK